MPPQSSDSPAKKQSKWSPEEDALIIELRGSGMKWDDISKHLPGRSPISCRLHYQNYLERRSEWDEERKNKLARLYERFKPEMWARVAEELQVPWRAAEAMHWQLGENEMARRAGVVPFSLASGGAEMPQSHRRASPARSHTHSQSQGSVQRELPGILSPRYSITPGHGPAHTPVPPSIAPPIPAGRGLAARRESLPPRHDGIGYSHSHSHSHPGPGLAPIHTAAQGRGGVLPGVSELTTGVSHYNTPAYSVGVSTASPIHSGSASPGHHQPLPSFSSYPPLESSGAAKRRASPEMPPRETSRRRHLEPRSEEGGYSASRR